MGHPASHRVEKKQILRLGRRLFSPSSLRMKKNRLRSFADLCGLGDLDQLAALYVVDITVDRDIRGHERMLADALDVVAHALCIVFYREPLDVVTRTRAGAFANVIE